MTKLIKCPCCLGVKDILKMGCSYGPCDDCDGKGQVEAIPEIEDISIPAVASNDEPTGSESEAEADKPAEKVGGGKKKK